MEIKKEFELSKEHFGPFWEYVDNDEITDVDFNGRHLWISTTSNERTRVLDHNITPEDVVKFSHFVANSVNKPFNKEHNLLEADTDRLRISIVHESAAVSGRSVCIRKTLPSVRMTEESMIRDRYCTKKTHNLLSYSVMARLNFVFCGEPGSGKTEGVKYFSQFIPGKERVITIEDTPELRYSEINPDKDSVEFMVYEGFDYTKAIKTSLRQNPKRLMLSEARSVEVKFLLESWSTGVRGFTTLHCDDVRNIPDRIMNMLPSRQDADRMENSIYNYLGIGILIRRKADEKDKVYRCIEQVCFYYREDGQNKIFPVVMGGEFVATKFPDAIIQKFKNENMDVFSEEGEFIDEE